jgi:hypothetical protein
VDGIYLLSMRLRMVGLENALPIFMVFGTPGSTVAALDDAALPWVEQQLDLPGDFNKDGVVDAADYVFWRKQTSDEANYNLWKAHFGQAAELRISAGSGGAANLLADGDGYWTENSRAAGLMGTVGRFGTVPEPDSWLIIATGYAGLAAACRRLTIRQVG